tara:strand:+ start:29306 stop:29527 length:222 start_codon:yes stop_codon:yes gene_type:complete
MFTKKVRSLFWLATLALWCVTMMIGVGGCQSDARVTFEHSGRVLHKDEGAASRYSSPMFGHQWGIGNLKMGEE